MKNGFIAILLLLCGQTLFAEDEYLYWTIAQDATLISVSGGSSLISDGSYYAKVGYADIGADATKEGLQGYLNLYEQPGDTKVINDRGLENDSAIATQDNGDIAGIQNASVFASFRSISASNYSYWIELLNEAGSVEGYASLGTYSDLSDYISSMKGMALPSLTFTAKVFHAPEPSSGLLLVLGCAALALRRRKMQKA